MTTVDRILSVDYGVKRIGLALSDALGITAQEFDTINVLKKDEHFLRIKEIVEKEKVKKILVGMPLNMNGSKGERAREVEKFIEKLKRYVNITIITRDERLTSVEAKKIMISLGQKTGKNKEKIDRLAAVLLLETYLGSISNK